MIHFFGKKKQLKALLQFLMQRYGRDARVRDIPRVVCN